MISVTNLHESISHHDSNISSTVAVRSLTKVSEVLLGQMVWGLSEVQLEHVRPAGGKKHYTASYQTSTPSLPRMSIWKVDVNSLLKPSPYSGVQDPGDVGGSQHQDAIVIIAHSLYKTSFTPPSLTVQWLVLVDLLEVVVFDMMQMMCCFCNGYFA